MKKFSLTLLAILAIFFTGCSSDDDELQSFPVPVSKTTTTDDLSTYSLTRNLLSQIFNESKNVLATQNNVTIEYDGRIVLKKTTEDDSGNVTVQDYYYKNIENGLLDSIVITQNQVFNGVQKYVIENDRIKAIENYDADRNLIQRDEVISYNGDKVTQFSSKINTDYGFFDLTSTVTYSGDDVVSVEMTGTLNDVTFTSSLSYTYDDKNNSELNVITKEQPFHLKHNIKTHTLNSVFYGNTLSMETNYEYTYNDDDYPVVYSSTSISNYGANSMESVTIEYENK